jgi:release factor glutamine methyltransferase
VESEKWKVTNGQVTIRTLLNIAGERLSGIDSGRLDAEVLLARVLVSGRESLYAHPEQVVSTLQAETFLALIEARSSGYPVAYLLGGKEFWSVELSVNDQVLIPRPETELLVETALGLIPDVEGKSILDLGTGSGVIAVIVARERPLCAVHASDISLDALQLAQLNKTRYKLENIHFRCSDWLEAFDVEQFNFILCNPPYVDSLDPALTQGETRFEPRLALDGGRYGMQAFNALIPATRRHLYPGGYLLLEHGYTQGAPVRNLLSANGFAEVTSLRDIAGHERVSLGRWI